MLSPRKKDATRAFSGLERETVFFRDRELCQWCRMHEENHKVSWGECEIHHVIPHSEGGLTNTDNAALVHRECHPKVKEQVEAFHEWWRHGGAIEPEEEKTRQTVTGRRFPPPDGTEVKFTHGNQTYWGEIRDGQIVLNGEREDAAYRSFSAASVDITGTSRNGWKDWLLSLPGEDSWILADEWRRGQ